MQNRAVRPSLTLVVAVVLSMVLAACASDSAESDEPTASDPATPESAASEPAASEPASEEEPSAGGGAPEPPGEMGSFTVNDTVFAVTMLNRCIPFTEAPGNIDLQALAQGAQLNLTLSSDMVEVSVQGPAIEEAFGSIAFGDSAAVSESAVTDDRWGGSATVGDSMGSDTTVDIAWDVMVPAEINDCSL